MVNQGQGPGPRLVDLDPCDSKLSIYGMAGVTRKWTTHVIDHFFDVAITKCRIHY